MSSFPYETVALANTISSDSKILIFYTTKTSYQINLSIEINNILTSKCCVKLR